MASWIVWILVPWPGIEPGPQQWKHQVLPTIELLGNSREVLLFSLVFVKVETLIYFGDIKKKMSFCALCMPNQSLTFVK